MVMFADDLHRLVWYVSYGSNMSRSRFECYLRGGRAPGAARTHVGARDRTAPRADAGVFLPGRIWFAGESRLWGGGVSYYDHSRPGPTPTRTPARAYLVTAGQFADVHRQEGPRYRRRVHLGYRDGVPMYTFTAEHGIDDVPHARPSTAYLDTVRAGVLEAHGWGQHVISQYLGHVLPAGTALPVDNLPRVENSLRVEGALDVTMQPDPDRA